jgi:hypothetical protein
MKDFVAATNALSALAEHAPALVPLVLSLAVLVAFAVIGLIIWRAGKK